MMNRKDEIRDVTTVNSPPTDSLTATVTLKDIVFLARHLGHAESKDWT